MYKNKKSEKFPDDTFKYIYILFLLFFLNLYLILFFNL